MEPISVDEAIEIAKNKRLRPGVVRGTEENPVIQFTKGRNDRIEPIAWEEFKQAVESRKLQIYHSGGWMKIMKKPRK